MNPLISQIINYLKGRDINEKEILQKDFLFAFEKVKPRITQETLKYYKDFEDNRKLLQIIKVLFG